MHILLLAPPAAPEPERGLLSCQVCGSQRVVLDHLDCRALGPIRGEVRIGRDGLHLDPTATEHEGGASVGLRSVCEHGHQSILRFRQVRSATVVERTVLPWTFLGNTHLIDG